MAQPTHVLFSINDASNTWPDFSIRFDAQTKVVAFSKAEEKSQILHCTPKMARELISILTQGLSMVFPEPEPDALSIMQEAQFPKDKDYALLTERIRPPFGRYSFELPDAPTQPGGVTLVKDDETLPNTGYIIRHESKDAYFTAKSEDTRTCDGSRLDARIFRTRYEFIKTTQGLKHGWTALEVPIFFLVGRRETPQSPIYWYTQADLTGTTVKRHATPLEEAAVKSIINLFVPVNHSHIVECFEKRS